MMHFVKLAIVLAIIGCLSILTVDGGRGRWRRGRGRGGRGGWRGRRGFRTGRIATAGQGAGGWGTETACENQCSETDHECVQSETHPFKWFCEEVVTDCGPLTAPVNGSVSTPNGTLIGEQAIYTCDSGFTIIGGTNPRVCQSDSNWSGTEPCCIIDCGPLSAPVDGFVTMTGTQEGDTAAFSCCIGHVLPTAASDTSTCQSTGAWSDPTPACELVDCGDPVVVPNAAVQLFNSSEFENLAVYTCAGNYLGYASCYSTGEWEGLIPQCLELCPALSAPDFGDIVSTGLLEGDTTTVICDVAFELSATGSETVTCQSNGEWNGALSTCDPVDCGPPPMVANSNIQYTTTVFESIAIYQCHPDYTLLGDAFMTCSSSGVWLVIPPICNPTPMCPEPVAPANGSVSYNFLTFGGTATYTCDGGYTLIGPCEVYCALVAGPAAGWSEAPPTCQIPCPQLTVPDHGDITTAGEFFPESANLVCDVGFVRSPAGDEIFCGSDGVWSAPIGTCVPVDCNAPPAVDNAVIEVTGGTVFEGVAEYTCNPDYDLVGDKFLTCQSAGVWIAAPPVCVLRPVCPTLLTSRDGTVSYSSPDRVLGTTAFFECNAGFTLIGQCLVYCVLEAGPSAVWTDAAPSCEKTCPELSAPANGDIVVTGTLEAGSTITLTCDLAFEQSVAGFGFLTCGSDGTWGGSLATCDPVDCGLPSTPTNGMRIISGTDFESQADYSCDPGYELVGPSYRTCLSDTNWSQSEPSCQAVDCGPLDCPCNGEVIVTDTTFGNSATYSCISGFSLVGNTTRTCLDTGLWDGEPPCCVAPVPV